MLKRLNNIYLIILYHIIISFTIINSQNSNENLIKDNCVFGNLSTNNEEINELNDDILNNLITLNSPRLNQNSILMYFGNEFQIYLFKTSECTDKFLENNDLIKNYYNNNLHLFSIDLSYETDINIIKLVIQTKKEFQIFYYSNGERIYTQLNHEIYYNIKTNVFPYFITKIFYLEEYQLFENQNIDIFNEDDKIFNDICFTFESFNITKPPELRKALYFYKNDIKTYPLLNSSNCYIYGHSISYENKSFILEYKCKKDLNISSTDIQINNINIISRNDIEEYKGPNSLKDQKSILKCNKEAFKKNQIENNAGFYISLVLIVIVFICLIILIMQKYEIKYDEEILLEAPPKKKTLKESLKEKKENKNVKFDDNELIQEQKKKKRKKKIKISYEEQEKNNQENNDDLNWYSNSFALDNEQENGVNSNKEENDFYENEKHKKHRKKRKAKSMKKSNRKKEIDLIINNSENKNIEHNDSDINSKNEEKDTNNNTNIKQPDAYKKFQMNSVIKLQEKLKLRRLVIITNLGTNLSKSNLYNAKTDIILQNKPKLNSRNISNENALNNNLKKSSNNLIDTNNEKEVRKEIMGNILGLEDKTFMSNILRDYLEYDDATYFDRRDNCDIFCHFMKIKNDLINVFYLDYSFAPYTIRLIKFAFFFLFLFYLETLCIGQKYYFEKFYSNEFQDFLYDNNFYNNSRKFDNITLLEKDFEFDGRKFADIHYLYTFKYAFPRVLIPAALSLISYIFTSALSPRRKIIKILLNIDYTHQIKKEQIKLISKKYKIIYIIFGILALFLMVFFFYSIVVYFYVFEDAKYDIPQSFILSGLLRFIFDILLWSFITELRICSLQTRFDGFYNLINKVYEIN